MTVIISLKDKKNKRIILGADTRTTRGHEIGRPVNKIISIPIEIVDGYGETKHIKELHIAICGYAFYNTFFEYGFIPPLMSEQQSFIEYLYNSLLPELRNLLHEENLVMIDNNVSDSECTFIFVFQDMMYQINSHFSVDYAIDDGFLVNGSGQEVALGSLYTNLHFHKNMNYEDIVEQAIVSSGANTVYCNKEVNIKVIPY